MLDREDRVRQRAHEIWEAEGRPEGRDQEHWERASREIASEASEISPGNAPSPDDPTADKSQPGKAAAASASRKKP